MKYLKSATTTSTPLCEVNSKNANEECADRLANVSYKI